MSKVSADGFLNLNKPLHLTSHDVVSQVRRRYRALTRSKKVGHAGTLDPLADGVLVMCLGAATRLSDYMMRGRKVYRAQVKLGETTSTYDAAGEVETRHDAGHISLDALERALLPFNGDLDQIPPMYSAIKVKGKKLYELAREGKSVERAPRKVTIHSIDVLAWDNPVAELKIHCGPGTYVRSLAHDLGRSLGVGAYLSGLTRIASGSFRINESIPLETVMQDDNWTKHIVPPFDALSHYTRVTLSADEMGKVKNGGFISRRNEIEAGTVFAFDANQQLVAILQPRDELWKPHKVFLN